MTGWKLATLGEPEFSARHILASLYEVLNLAVELDPRHKISNRWQDCIWNRVDVVHPHVVASVKTSADLNDVLSAQYGNHDPLEVAAPDHKVPCDVLPLMEGIRPRAQSCPPRVESPQRAQLRLWSDRCPVIHKP